MGSDYGKLMAFFEDPFWVGIFERIESGKLSVCRVVFGAEPKDYEVWEFVLANYHQLRFSPSVDVAPRKEAVNPKRIQREARKQTAGGIGTKSQQALQLLREESKRKCKEITRQQREAEKQRQYDLKQQKRREKHRGR